MKSKEIQIRHVATPSVSFTYAPDFGAARYGYYDTYTYTDEYGEVRMKEYSPYEGATFGVPGKGKSESISFSLDNNIEMKMKSDKDSTGYKKISLIDQLSANMSYNMAAVEKPWSDLSVNLRLKLPKNYTFNMNASFATYAYEFDERGNVVVGNRTEWSYGRFGRFQGYSGSLSYSLNNDTFKKLFGKKEDDEKKGQKDEGEKQDEQTEEEKEQPSYTCSLVCVGDNLIHDNIYNEALKLGGGEKYDFTQAYEHVTKYIEGTDVAIINQETLVTDSVEPQSYPMFASPTAVGDKIVDMGFNVVSMSNNHVLDQGEEGLISSLDYWDTKGIVHYGAYRSQEDADTIKTMEVNGIKFAFLGYMEHTNGNYLSGDGAQVIYLDEEDKIKAQIEEADKMADVVVVSCHYGTEIQNELNEQQTEITPKLVEWGADLIIGTQAHTISTCGYLDKPEGGQAFVYYGLGNFISTMYDTKSLVGLIGKLNVVKDPDTNEVTFENVKAIPIISHFEGDSYYGDWYNCTVYPYAEYTDELFAKNYVEGFTRESVQQCLSYPLPVQNAAYWETA